MSDSFVSALLSEIAPTLGIQIEFEPEFGFVGEITFPDGKKHLFKNRNLNLNLSASSDIAKDKFYTNYFLQKKRVQCSKRKNFFFLKN
ncbi:hypothetical protein DaDZ19_40350 [Dickeya ananatis]